MSWLTHLLAASGGAGIGLVAAAMLVVNRDQKRTWQLETLVLELYSHVLDYDVAKRYEHRLAALGMEVER